MNILLNDTQRSKYDPVIKSLFDLCPETMSRKIEKANVQQAFVFSMVMDYVKPDSKILSVGCYEDTAYEALQKLSIPAIGIDPFLNTSLSTFYKLTHDKFDIIFSTSVIEHVQDDEEFIAQICDLLKPSGLAILTCDFRNDFIKGDPKPSEDCRLYTEYDLVVRLNRILNGNGCKIFGEINYSGEPDFWYGMFHYSFASYTFIKN